MEKYTDWQILIDKFPLIDIKSRQPYQPCGKGWNNILDTMFYQLTQLIALGEIVNIQVNQIKEKFGILRVYIQPTFKTVPTDLLNHKLYKIVTDAETQSASTCEICGEHGKPRSGGWIKTLCDKHWELHNADKEKCWKEAYE